MRGAVLMAGLLLSLALPTEVESGAYLFASEVSTDRKNAVCHPTGYVGVGGTLTVTVCIEPDTPNAADIVTSVKNVINTFNRRTAAIGNLVIPSPTLSNSELDWESATLHEVGHCLGMAHVNLATESGLSEPDRNYTKSTDGADNAFDRDDGVDGVIGSRDDLRDDDENLYWFSMSANDPFVKDTVVDSTTVSFTKGSFADMLNQ